MAVGDVTRTGRTHLGDGDGAREAGEFEQLVEAERVLLPQLARDQLRLLLPAHTHMTSAYTASQHVT